MKQIEVVAAIIRKDDKIFATQRGYGDFKDWWEFPGGKIEAGETPEEAFMLQGFPVDFVKRAREKEVSDGALYTQSGNAVSVNTIYAVLHFLIMKRYIKRIKEQ